MATPEAGSPPLTRGPRFPTIESAHTDGITPAHAGTTSTRDDNPVPSTDHPRSRGDHEQEGNDELLNYGSPPLTRGPPGNTTLIFSSVRITPAHAGTTDCDIVMFPMLRDHPRSRGDHVHPPLLGNTTLGSPPLTRGPLYFRQCTNS